MPTISFTVTAAEGQRVTNAALDMGFPDAKSMLVAYAKSVVAAFEQAQAIESIAPPTPIAPT